MRFVRLITIVLLAVFVTSVQAQAPVDILDSLSVEFWPDYDQPQVLVLLTGTLPSNTSLPAEINLPLPAEANLNAVARIDTQNTMVDDVDYEESAGVLTFITPDQRFRIEYYVPYTDEDDQHAYTYDWVSDLAVNQFEAIVQQPAAANSMETNPPADEIVIGQADGLMYHALPPQTLAGGDAYAISFRYPMAQTTLSVTALTQGGVGETAVNSTPPATLSNSNWLLILGGLGLLLIAIAVTWQVATTRTPPPRKNRRPKRVVSSQQKNKINRQVKYCHSCGQSITVGDQFCRNCGTRLKV